MLSEFLTLKEANYYHHCNLLFSFKRRQHSLETATPMCDVLFIDVKDITGHEELILTTMVAMNNLCFYSSPGTAMEDNEVETSRCKYLYFT